MTLDGRFRRQLGDFSLDVAFEAPARGVSALFGPSGSGKTSVLRCIAGLEQARGSFRLGNEAWQDDAQGLFLPAHQRPVGYVFQEASLFPHLSVRRNLEYGAKRSRGRGPRVDFEHAITLLGLSAMLDRDPGQLSGGERQRVAIARALLSQPRLLLMDEPLAALDLASKAEILPFLERLHRELEIPVLYVSHAPEEVARLADHMILLEHGHVRAAGPVDEMLTRVDLPLAHGSDAATVVEARVASHDDTDGLTALRFSGGELLVPRTDRAPGSPVRIRIMARDVSIALDHNATTSILNIFPATVETLEPESAGQVTVRLRLDGITLLSRITQRSARLLELQPGRQVHAQIKGIALLG